MCSSRFSYLYFIMFTAVFLIFSVIEINDVIMYVIMMGPTVLLTLPPQLTD